MFQGFSQESMDFLWGIRFNNERGWFLAHKEDFLTYVDGPMKELAGQLDRAMGEKYPHLGLQTKVSRIYRDARRLHGRGPYKDHIWLGMRRVGEARGAFPTFYFELAPNYYSIGLGCWDPTPLTAAKLRARIDRDPKPLEELALRLKGREEFQLYGEEYKRPKGDPGPLLASWYNRRQIGISADYNCEGVLFTPELFRQVMEHFDFLVPYYDYLIQLSGDPAPDHT